MEIGEVFLEIGIVFASLAILSKRQLVWVVSMVSALQACSSPSPAS